ncbi:hypothetical protein M758_8G142300, partial [Ceratodon purpureus]
MNSRYRTQPPATSGYRITALHANHYLPETTKSRAHTKETRSNSLRPHGNPTHEPNRNSSTHNPRFRTQTTRFQTHQQYQHKTHTTTTLHTSSSRKGSSDLTSASSKDTDCLHTKPNATQTAVTYRSEEQNSTPTDYHPILPPNRKHRCSRSPQHSPTPRNLPPPSPRPQASSSPSPHRNPR